MIGDFPIQFSTYTNCPLHHVILAWEACEELYSGTVFQNILIIVHHVALNC